MKSLLNKTAMVLVVLAASAASNIALAGHHGLGSLGSMHKGGSHGFGGSNHKSFAQHAPQNNQAHSLANSGGVKTGSVNAGNNNSGKINTGNVKTGASQIGTGQTGKGNAGNANSGKVQTGSVKTGNNNSGNINTGNVKTGGTQTGKSNGKSGNGKGKDGKGKSGKDGKGKNGKDGKGKKNKGNDNNGDDGSDDGGLGGSLADFLGGFGGFGGGDDGGDGGSGGGGFAGGGDGGGFAPAPAQDFAPAPVQASAPVQSSAPAVAATGNLRPIDIRLVDSGVPSEGLGPRYRVTVLNDGDANINQEFTVKLSPTNDSVAAANLPGSIKRVSGLNGGASTTVDVRLPQGTSAQNLVIAVDAEQEISTASLSNSTALMAVAAIPAISR